MQPMPNPKGKRAADHSRLLQLGGNLTRGKSGPQQESRVRSRSEGSIDSPPQPDSGCHDRQQQNCYQKPQDQSVDANGLPAVADRSTRTIADIGSQAACRSLLSKPDCIGL